MAEIIVMPKLTATMQAGKVHKWYREVGQEIEKDEVLVEVIADKAMMQIEAPVKAFLLKKCCLEGADLAVGKPLAYLGEQGEEVKQAEKEPIGSLDRQFAAERPAEQRKEESRVKATPVAKKMAKALNVELSLVKGSGKGGLIGKTDVEEYYNNRAAESAEEFIVLDGIRKVMAEKMALSRKTAAHATTVAEVDMYNLSLLKKKQPFGFTAAVIYAAAQALREFPLINSSLQGDRIILRRAIDIAVAVSTEQGLMVPVIRAADQKSLEEIDSAIKRLAEKARAGQLTLAEMEAATFTVTNSGVFGSLFFTPIINQPQSAIIGMGKVMDTPVARNGEVLIRPMLYLSLSYDHRIIEGGLGVRFLQNVKAGLENWPL